MHASLVRVPSVCCWGGVGLVDSAQHRTPSPPHTSSRGDVLCRSVFGPREQPDGRAVPASASASGLRGSLGLCAGLLDWLQPPPVPAIRCTLYSVYCVLVVLCCCVSVVLSSPALAGD